MMAWVAKINQRITNKQKLIKYIKIITMQGKEKLLPLYSIVVKNNTVESQKVQILGSLFRVKEISGVEIYSLCGNYDDILLETFLGYQTLAVEVQKRGGILTESENITIETRNATKIFKKEK